jgi:Ca2+-binding EF-hand superfamily protein
LPQLQAMFAEFDKDNNKKISKEEYAQFVKEIK